MTWLDCNQRSYIWIFGWTLREDVRLACAQMPELFFDLPVSFQMSAKEQKIIYANLYLNIIIKQEHVYFVTSNNSGLIRPLKLIKVSCNIHAPSIT